LLVLVAERGSLADAPRTFVEKLRRVAPPHPRPAKAGILPGAVPDSRFRGNDEKARKLWKSRFGSIKSLI
jgi:hypothetical protein